MTNSMGDRDTIWLERFRWVWKNGLSPLASPCPTNHCSRPPESLKSNSITCQACDQSLFVNYDLKTFMIGL